MLVVHNGFCLWYEPFEFSEELEKVVKQLFIEDHVVQKSWLGSVLGNDVKICNQNAYKMEQLRSGYQQ